MKNIVLSLYAILCVGFVIFSFLFVDQNLSFLKYLYSGFSNDNRLVSAIIYTIFISLFFLFYFYFIFSFKYLTFRILKIIIGISAILTLSYPAVLSYDIFNYILTAKVTFFYLENPYIIMPIDFMGDPLLEFTRATNKTALYGPLWILLTGIPFLLGFGKFVLTMYLFKAFVAVFYFVIVSLLHKLTRDIKAVLIFALNPLVLIETFVSGHNDVVMMSLLLLGIMLFLIERYSLSFISVLSSILIKYATIFLVPSFIILVSKLMKKKEVNLSTVSKYSLIPLSIIFALSPFREELYPWYFLWIIPFISILHKNKRLLVLSLAFSYGLMLRYIPFMATGNYFGFTPITRNILMVLPVLFTFLYLVWKKKLLK